MSVYIFDRLDRITDDVLQKLIGRLPEGRKQKALSFRFTEGRKLCAVAYRMAEHILETEYGIHIGDFGYTEYGKPYIPGYPDIFFNISHCKYGCICAFSDCGVGADIQEIITFDAKLAERICTENELEMLSASADRDRELTRIWCMKEAYLKMVGTGLSGGMKNADTTLLREHIAVRDFGRYIAALSLEKDRKKAEAQLENAVLLDTDIFF